MPDSFFAVVPNEPAIFLHSIARSKPFQQIESANIPTLNVPDRGPAMQLALWYIFRNMGFAALRLPAQ